jgi:anti-sigma regulatory factor (Ser/Thr protein kinase)
MRTHLLPLPSPPEQAGCAALDEAFEPVDLRLPARPTELKRARDCVAAAAADFGFARKTAYELVFAVNEAVTNAIKHGTPHEDGTIGLTIDADGDALVCSVQDAGPFVPPRTPREAATAEGGRGFAFMSALTDEFELLVKPAATIVRLRKLRPALVASA